MKEVYVLYHNEPVIHVEYFLQPIADHTRGVPADHVTGLLGEDAVAQHLGVADYLDIEVYADGGDSDVKLHYRGATIDVKTLVGTVVTSQ